MNYIIKSNIVDHKSLKYLDKPISNYLNNHSDYKGYISTDYRNRVRIDTIHIPFMFNNYIVYISSESFQQNHKTLAKYIRSCVNKFVNYPNNMICIGGESYMYGLITNANIYHYTNNISIFNDCKFNGDIYTKNISNYLCNYNNVILNTTNIYNSTCIINLSKLNTNIINQVKNNSYEKIIIINCHHEDFWKKTKQLTNYKLIFRKKFTCNVLKYFITVSVFRLINIISIGSNCAPAFHLKYYGLRNTAYPFDWCKIDLNKLIKVLNNDFKDFEKVCIQKFSHKHPSFVDNSDSTYMIKNKYNVKFAHEITNEVKLNHFSTSILKRIKRFKNIINPCFIRLETGKVSNIKYNDLVDALDKYYSEYKLIIVSKEIITHPRIIYVPIGEYSQDWKYNSVNWKYLFYKS